MKAATWTQSEKVDYLLQRTPWTIVRDESVPYVLLRCVEISDATGSGETEAEAEADFWESLRASLEAIVHFGDRVPAGTELP